MAFQKLNENIIYLMLSQDNDFIIKSVNDM